MLLFVHYHFSIDCDRVNNTRVDLREVQVIEKTDGRTQGNFQILESFGFRLEPIFSSCLKIATHFILLISIYRVCQRIYDHLFRVTFLVILTTFEPTLFTVFWCFFDKKCVAVFQLSISIWGLLEMTSRNLG